MHEQVLSNYLGSKPNWHYALRTFPHMYTLPVKYCKEYKTVAVLIVIRYFVNVVHIIWHSTHLSKEFVKNDYDQLKLMTHFYQNLPENVNHFLEAELRINTFVNNSSSVY